MAALSAFVLLSSIPVANCQNESVSVAEITWSKKYPSSGFAPVVNEYVQYDVTVLNTGDTPIENQSLWVSFVSRGGETRVNTAFSVPLIDSGERTMLHLGPFKMRGTGDHSLFLGMNGQADSSLPNEVGIGHDPMIPVDTFTVYDPTLIQLIPIATSSAAAGIAILVGLVYFQRRKTP
ncbi:MAG TPA: hypothetical protein VLA68_07430 [Nitrososphaera sp.]|nr:hypothetical protein [Nitrososphaera sp.]